MHFLTCGAYETIQSKALASNRHRYEQNLTDSDFSTLVNVYVSLPVFTPVAGSSYAHFMVQNGGAQYVNSEFGRYFNFCLC